MSVKSADITAAIALARATVGAADDVPAVFVPVRRLDRDAEYVLVQLGHPGEPGWVAAIDPAQDEVMTWAANPSGESTAPIRSESDRPDGEVEWVWRPSAHSRSPLYPILRITTETGELFVDLAGAVYDTLPDTHA